MKTIGILFGGDAINQNKSITRAINLYDNINKSKYEIVMIYVDIYNNLYTGEDLKDIKSYKDAQNITGLDEVTFTKCDDKYVLLKKNGLFRQKPREIDLIFPVTYDDYKLISSFDYLGIPIVGNKTEGALLSNDKIIRNDILRANKINIPYYTWFYSEEYLNKKEKVLEDIEGFEYPLSIQPAHINNVKAVCENYDDVLDSVDEMVNLDDKIIVIKELDYKDKVSIAIYKNKSKLVCSNICTLKNDKFEVVDIEYKDKLINNAVKAYEVLNLRGVKRFDYVISDDEYTLINISNLPSNFAYSLFDNEDYRGMIENLISEELD